MVKRLFDILAATTALVLLSPLFLLAAIGIRLSDRGPVFYRATRAGRNGKPFQMHKFRTMTTHQGPMASVITASQDARVFVFGRFLRMCKIDELPQLYDVLRGEMSIVGPRPEALPIVLQHYAPAHWETLQVRPGLASPGSIYNYTHGEKLIGNETPEQDYLTRLLPVKLALELVYLRKSSFLYDLRIVFRTIWVILLIALGKQEFPEPPETSWVGHIVPVRNITRAQITVRPLPVASHTPCDAGGKQHGVPNG